MLFLPALGREPISSGCSSGVERNLAKVEVVSSNLITRSIFNSRLRRKLKMALRSRIYRVWVYTKDWGTDLFLFFGLLVHPH